MKRFAGKVALVTGATHGIGQAAAVRLAADGAVVAVNQRPNGDPGETMRRIEQAGGSGFPLVADMRDAPAVRAMVAETVRRAGRLDILVSNAAINPLIAWDEITDELWDDIHNTNLRGTWVVCQAAAKEMIGEGHGGAIIAVSSISAWVGASMQVAYTPTKAAISNLMKSLAIVLGPHGIRCNAVLPGAILTNMSKDMLQPGRPELAEIMKRVPLGRVGQPEDIGDVIAFLASDDARYVNGAELLVDGGWLVALE
jgi:NAD(P)-dependent dehydrogenase (short-subunit alcohol dehydrogenase family)